MSTKQDTEWRTRLSPKMRKLVADLEANGWTARKTANCHLQLNSPTGVPVMAGAIMKDCDHLVPLVRRRISRLPVHALDTSSDRTDSP